VGLRRRLLHHQQLHRHRHRGRQRSQPHRHVHRQVSARRDKKHLKVFLVSSGSNPFLVNGIPCIKKEFCGTPKIREILRNYRQFKDAMFAKTQS